MKSRQYNTGRLPAPAICTRVIRRWHYRDHFSIREISRRTGLSRNTVRKYLRSDGVEPKFAVPDRPSKLDPYADKLSPEDRWAVVAYVRALQRAQHGTSADVTDAAAKKSLGLP